MVYLFLLLFIAPLYSDSLTLSPQLKVVWNNEGTVQSTSSKATLWFEIKGKSVSLFQKPDFYVESVEHVSISQKSHMVLAKFRSNARAGFLTPVCFKIKDSSEIAEQVNFTGNKPSPHLIHGKATLKSSNGSISLITENALVRHTSSPPYMYHSKTYVYSKGNWSFDSESFTAPESAEQYFNLAAYYKEQKFWDLASGNYLKGLSSLKALPFPFNPVLKMEIREELAQCMEQLDKPKVARVLRSMNQKTKERLLNN